MDWDHTLGSNLLDMALSRHFTTEFADKHKLPVEDILSNAKAMAKMKKQARRTKEILSANNAAPFSVEEFYDGKDFQVCGRGKGEKECRSGGGVCGREERSEQDLRGAECGQCGAVFG